MSGIPLVVMEITRMEAHVLADLVEQFVGLVDETDDGAPDDDAIARLLPDAYPDDPEAAREFRDLTAEGLLRRRRDDAGAVLASLRDLAVDDPSSPDALDTRTVGLAADDLAAWLRTLTALRLVLAARLGIRSEDDSSDEDPRFGVYDWLGYRLEGLLQAIEE